MALSPELVASLERLSHFFWRGRHWEVTAQGPRLIREPLKLKHLEAHNVVRVGLGPIVPGTSTTRVAVLDLDSHRGEMEWEDMVEVGLRIAESLRKRDLVPIPFRSSGGKGIHIYVLWEEPQDAYSVRTLMHGVLAENGLKDGAGKGGVKGGFVETFPRQNEVAIGDHPNMVVLPMAGESLPLDPITFDLENYDLVEDMKAWPVSPAVPVLERPAPPIRNLEVSPNSGAIGPKLREALAAIPQETDPLDYDAWRNVIFALHDATGGSDEGLALAHEFSARSAKHDPDFLDNRVWPHIRDDRGVRVTERTIYALAREHGWEENVLDDFTDLGAAEPDGGRDSAEPGAQPATTAAPNPFEFVPVDEYVNRPPPRWVVRGVIPQTELVVIYGASKAGKSFLALDLAASVTRGLPWRGKKVKQGEVAYIAAEGAAGFRNRLVAYKRHHELDTLPGFRVLAAAPNLLKPDQVKALAAAAGRPSLIVVDTLAQAIPGADENSAEHMGALISSCKALHRLTGATIVLVHHAGKDPTRGMRGSSAVQGACDAVIEVSRGEGEQRVATIDKQKDGEDGAAFAFRLQVLPIGMDEEGEVIDSCVVEHLGEVKRAAVKPKGAVQQVVLETLDDLIALSDDRAVGMGELLDTAVERVPQDPEKRDQRRGRLARAIDDLVEKRVLTMVSGRLQRA